ncbi:MAG: hypothetical protein NC906_02220 [Candidatus Omnitrophica bacterium]|nr:hypothetical protein [Candidatus Omnitrophota bacterium]
MNTVRQVLKSGLKLTPEKLKLFVVVVCSTLFLISIIDHIFSKNQQETQFLWLLMVLMLENFLTCGVYGSLKKILLGMNLTVKLFFSNGAKFFLRFLIIKCIFIFFVIVFAGLLMLAVKATSGISLFAAASIILLWLAWLAFPAYYFLLSLFAPIVLFSENTGIIQSLKKAIFFCRKKLDKILVIAFFYFAAIAVLVYLPEKVYNISGNFWKIYKSITASFFEVSFISSLILLYQRELSHERNV